MTQFEYISVLISIVLALGLSEMLICWARLIQRREHIQFSWLHGFWSAFAIFMLVQLWYGFWNFRTVESWSLLALLLVVIETIILVISVLLITPGRNFPDDISLDDLFLDQAKPFFLMAMTMIVLVSILDAILLGTGLYTSENFVRAGGVITCLVGAFVKNRKIHYVLPAGSVILITIFNRVAIYI